MNQNQENKIFEVIGRLYFNSVLSDEQINLLNSRISQLQQEVITKSQETSSDKLNNIFIDKSKLKKVVVNKDE